MKFKKLACITSIITALTMPVLANAGHLTIANHTSYTLSFKVNNVCSKDFGLVYAYSIKNITKPMFDKFCKKGAMCEIMAYNDEHCKGEFMGGARYLVGQHHSEVIGSARKDITVTVNEFNLFFSESVK